MTEPTRGTETAEPGRSDGDVETASGVDGNGNSSDAGSRAPEASGLDPFLNTVCPYSWIGAVGVGLSGLFALLSLLSVIFLPPSAEAYPVSLLTLGLNGFILTVLGSLLFLCRRRNFR